jgi:acyl-CoA dehydrogenase
MSDTSYLAWPFFDASHRQLQAELEAWAAANISDEHHADTDQACRDFVASLGAAGWLRYAVGGTANGGKYDVIDTRAICLLRETLARHSGLADFAFAMQGLGSGAITLHGTAEQKQRYLTKVAAGTAIAAFALSEPDSGSDVAAMSCAARAEGDHYRARRRKDLDLQRRHRRLLRGLRPYRRSAWIARAVGLHRRCRHAGLRDRRTHQRHRPASAGAAALHQLPRAEDGAARHAGAGLQGGDADAGHLPHLGRRRRAGLRPPRAGFEALERATTRPMFNQTLADFQITQTKLAQMATGIDISALLTYRAAWQRDQGQNVTREAAMAKMTATETAQQVIDAAVQIWGGLGVVSEHPVEKLYREIRALRIYEGATEVQQLIIARQTLNAWENERVG